VGALRQLLRRWKGGLFQGEAHVELASHTFEQRVRLPDGAQRALVFFDRSYASAVGPDPGPPPPRCVTDGLLRGA
jgi:hypothetical protein